MLYVIYTGLTMCLICENTSSEYFDYSVIVASVIRVLD